MCLTSKSRCLCKGCTAGDFGEVSMRCLSSWGSMTQYPPAEQFASTLTQKYPENLEAQQKETKCDYLIHMDLPDTS